MEEKMEDEKTANYVNSLPNVPQSDSDELPVASRPGFKDLHPDDKEALMTIFPNWNFEYAAGKHDSPVKQLQAQATFKKWIGFCRKEGTFHRFLVYFPWTGWKIRPPRFMGRGRYDQKLPAAWVPSSWVLEVYVGCRTNAERCLRDALLRLGMFASNPDIVKFGAAIRACHESARVCQDLACREAGAKYESMAMKFKENCSEHLAILTAIAQTTLLSWINEQEEYIYKLDTLMEEIESKISTGKSCESFEKFTPQAYTVSGPGTDVFEMLYLDPYRSITTRLFIADPTYYPSLYDADHQQQVAKIDDLRKTLITLKYKAAQLPSLSSDQTSSTTVEQTPARTPEASDTKMESEGTGDLEHDTTL